MSQLCSCPRGPRCEYSGGACERPADWSFFTPPGRWIKTWPHGRFTFMCTPCRDYYVEALPKPLKGIDRPEGADEDWRGSLLDHIRHAQIAMAFEERDKRAEPADDPDDAKRFTPAQLNQVYVLRRALLEARQ